MSEFNSRIEAQRCVLEIVNSKQWNEELFGLSSKAVQRWTVANQLEPDLPVVVFIRGAAAELSFLANQSQDQISEEYTSSSQRIAELASSIREELLAL
jgi:hypothetical protein